MPFPFDKYPWLNFQELNLAYFIKHFREIFRQWDQLYHDLLDWKDATDADLAEWKTAVESGISSWETGLTEAMEVWKTQTETDIGAWEAATLAALEEWKTATTAVFEQIRTEAAASATAAAGSATAAETAKTAAQTAQALAEAAAAGIASELAQIQTNTEDIEYLLEAVNEFYKSEVFDYSSVSSDLVSWGISSAGNWTFGSGQKSYTASIPDHCKKITITGNGVNGSIIAFLNSYNPVTNTPADFSNQYDEREVIPAGETRTYVIGDSMHYLFALITDTQNNDKTPSTSFSYIITDPALISAHLPADAKTVGDAIWNGRSHSLTPHALVYSGTGTGDTYDAKTLPFDSWCYSTWGKLKGTFTDTDAPDFGFTDGTYVTIEKRILNNSTGGAYELTVRPTNSSGKVFVCRVAGANYYWFYPDSTLTKPFVPADAKTVGDAIWNGRDQSLTPHALVYSGTGTGDTYDAKTLPIDSWCYSTWGKLKGTFTDTGMPDFGISDGTYVTIEKRSVTNNGTGVYDLVVRTAHSSGKAFVCRVAGANYYWFYPDSTLAKPLVPADSKAVGDAIQSQMMEVTHDYDGDTETDWVITASTGTPWSKQGTATQSRAKIFKVPRGAVKMTLTPAASGNTVFTFLKSFEPEQNATPDFSAGWERTTVSGSTDMEYLLGTDCVYMYATVKTSTGADRTPSAVKFTCVRCDGDECRLESKDTNTSDETGKHDRSQEIMLMLNRYGVCRLANGIYYVSGITMPVKSSIIGEGRGTEIRLLASVESGTAVTMNAQCTLRDLTVSGGYTDRTPATDQDPEVGTRNGIEWTGDTMENGAIENCCVRNFTGAGIYLHDTSTATNKQLAISDCYLMGNDVGIDIRKNSEFNKIENSTFYKNYIGIRNRGGNNNISNCGIDWNANGILIDNDEGSNGGHGTITGCSVNHTGYANGSNGRAVGDGIVVEGTGRMVISNCNVYYSKLKLIDTNGNVVSNIGFGNLASLEISGGECSIVANCMFRRAQTSTDPDPVVYEDFPITITDNTKAKIINCFDRNGNEYTPA